MNEKVLITGTGRCGTTFLMLIYSYLKQNTGWGENAHSTLYKNCNSGLEKNLDSVQKILKSPSFLRSLQIKLEKQKDYPIKDVIIPIREYNLCAESRARHGKTNGGLIGKCKNKEEQIRYDYQSLAIFLKTAAKYDVPFTLLDFDRMVSDPNYLFNKIKHTLTDVTFEQFKKAYTKASNQQRKKA